MENKVLLIYICYICLMSTITMILYFADKVKAKKQKWRIKERTLLCFGLFGGAIGGLAGMRFFRHKTKHWYFWAVNIIGVIIHAAVLVLFFIKFR